MVALVTKFCLQQTVARGSQLGNIKTEIRPERGMGQLGQGLKRPNILHHLIITVVIIHLGIANEIGQTSDQNIITMWLRSNRRWHKELQPIGHRYAGLFL